MPNQSSLAALLSRPEHCSPQSPREVGVEVVMMYIWLVPLGIIALLFLYLFRKLGTKQ